VGPNEGATQNKIAAEKSRKFFNMTDSLVADAGDVHLAAIWISGKDYRPISGKAYRPNGPA
jgi:hypothetical protein